MLSWKCVVQLLVATGIEIQVWEGKSSSEDELKMSFEGRI